MTAYLDTGVFIDYLSQRGHAALRAAGRRGRTQAQVSADVEAILEKLAKAHIAFTSALTFYEVEEALYGSLAKLTAGVRHASTLLVPTARSIALQATMVAGQFDVSILDLTKSIIDSQIRELTFQVQGIRSADALHLTTAQDSSADVFITTDDALLSLDRVLTNRSGCPIRCIDTDVALGLL